MLPEFNTRTSYFYMVITFQPQEGWNCMENCNIKWFLFFVDCLMGDITSANKVRIWRGNMIGWKTMGSRFQVTENFPRSCYWWNIPDCTCALGSLLMQPFKNFDLCCTILLLFTENVRAIVWRPAALLSTHLVNNNNKRIYMRATMRVSTFLT